MILQYFNILTNSTPKKLMQLEVLFYKKEYPIQHLTQLEYKNGIKGHIFVSWLHPFKEHRLVVIGSEAMISFEDSSKKIDLKSGLPEKIDGPVEKIIMKTRCR